ncbi:hypothetical protein [Noviluteimonas gilva]|uniref:Uncharacterized protein n=1 Tax=Noviluteimonas gilva TaxID=2682097 RepID=A0A7C9I3B5_9GAMM|nr:hypothetical protein [Lysobacter gilvus]MUV12949.1 hypothetical protein [Lysobacter gilvus]
MTRDRIWTAYVAGILASAAAPALCIVAWILSTSEVRSDPTRVPMAFLFVFVVALAHSVLLGAPYAAWLRRRGWFAVLPMVMGGFVAGVVPVMLIASGASLTRDDGMALDWIVRQAKDLLLFATLGATGALAFYGAFRAVQPESAATAG